MGRASSSRRLVRERGQEQFHTVVPKVLGEGVFCGMKLRYPEFLDEQPPIEHACENCRTVFRGVARGMAEGVSV